MYLKYFFISILCCKLYFVIIRWSLRIPIEFNLALIGLALCVIMFTLQVYWYKLYPQDISETTVNSKRGSFSPFF